MITITCILPNSIIIISLLVSVISVLVGFFTPSLSGSSHSIFSNPPKITSHIQCGDIATAVSE